LEQAQLLYSDRSIMSTDNRCLDALLTSSRRHNSLSPVMQEVLLLLQ